MYNIRRLEKRVPCSSRRTSLWRAMVSSLLEFGRLVNRCWREVAPKGMIVGDDAGQPITSNAIDRRIFEAWCVVGAYNLE